MFGERSDHPAQVKRRYIVQIIQSREKFTIAEQLSKQRKIARVSRTSQRDCRTLQSLTVRGRFENLASCEAARLALGRTNATARCQSKHNSQHNRLSHQVLLVSLRRNRARAISI